MTGWDVPDGVGGDAGASMGGGRLGVGQVRAALAGAAEVLSALPQLIWAAGGAELGALLGELDRVAVLAGAGRVAVSLEAVARGEVAASQCASVAAWVGQHAPSLAGGGGAGQVARCVEEVGKPRLGAVKEAVLSGALAVPVALVVVCEFDKLRRRIVPDAEALVLQGLVRIGCEDGAREVRRLGPRLLAEHGADGEFQAEQDKAAGQLALSHPVAVQEGVWEYLLRADAEAKAVLEAAIGPLSAPWHPTGTRDPRSAQQRRGQALVEVCRRVTAAAKAAGVFGGHPRTDANPAGRQPEGGHGAGRQPGGDRPSRPPGAAASAGSGPPGPHRPPVDRLNGDDPWAQPAGDDTAGDDPQAFDPAMIQAALAGMGAGGAKATLMLTMPLRELTERVGAATVQGTTEHGTLLAPETARRIACDAGIIPVVLGTRGEVLDLGRTERLFSPAQARAVLLRDRHCSFPSCDIPAFWCQLHHVVHWLDGGATDLGNAALLCSRHHTIVHRDRLTATVTPTGVHWDTTPASYDHALTRDRTPAA